MINLQEYLYKKIKNILDSWDLSDSYSVSFSYIQMNVTNIKIIQIFQNLIFQKTMKRFLKKIILEKMKVYIVKIDGIMLF